MNTTITIKVNKTDEPTVLVQDKIEEAFGEFDRIVKQYTRFDENSELSNLNRMSGNWVKVSDEFFYLINFMLDLATKTNGAFDPTIIDFLEVYGYDKNYDFSKLDNPELDKLVEKISNQRKSWKDIKIDEENKSVKLAKGQKIDLGGVGKGYAIDCAFNQLTNRRDKSRFVPEKKTGVKNFLIDAGGDVRVFGKNENDKPWKVGLKNKNNTVVETRHASSLNNQGTNHDLSLQNNIIGFTELPSGSALASSGSWARRVKQFHHLINPQTGKPHEASYSTVYVKAPTAIEADGWATALFISGEKCELPSGFQHVIL